MKEFHVALVGHSKIDFDRRVIRKALRKASSPVRREARKLIGRRNGAGRVYRVWGDMLHRASVAGAAPAKLSGWLQRSIDVKVGNGGFAVWIGPNIKRGYHARFLAGGTKDMAARPFMDRALAAHETPIAAMLETALVDALVPR